MRLVMLLLSVVLLELGCRIAVAAGVVPYQLHPITQRPQYWDSLEPAWGVWRHPGGSVRAVMPCFDITYRSNSEGMRDAEVERRAPAGVRRIAVLGDSFTEGVGVPLESRFDELVEAGREDLECLNFGVMGSGYVHQLMIHRELASEFDHDAVAWFTLPYNDAFDSDPARSADYRPLLEAEGDGYRVRYPMPFDERPRVERSTTTVVRNWLFNSSYLLNVARTAARTLNFEPEALALQDFHEGPSYDSFRDEDVRQLLWCYRQVVEEGEGRPVHVFLIPTRYDFEAGLAGRDRFALPAQLAEAAADLEGLEVHDLLPRFLEDARATGSAYDDYVIWCDGHWNARGHRIAAEALREALGS